MDLLEALAVQQGDRLALVGGGGKTGLAYRLVQEAQARNWTAVFGTTTKVLAPTQDEPAWTLLEETAESALPNQLAQTGRLFLAQGRLDLWDDGPTGRRQKLGGLGPQHLDRLARALRPDLLVVEADGSRHRPFKAPAEHEPVIPASTTLLVALAGLDVLGRPLGPEWVHRPERVCALGGVPPGSPVGPALLAAVLNHPQGGLKGRPAGCRAAALLSQASSERRPAGRHAARRLLQHGAYERVLLADLNNLELPVECWLRDAAGQACERRGAGRRVGAVILAAGQSRRLGRNKLLLPLAGRPLLLHAVEAALGSRADQVWVVLGATAAKVRPLLEPYPLRPLYNERWAEGQSSSLQAAIAAQGPECAGLLFLAGDMPFVPPAHLDRLIGRFRQGHAVVWSGDGGRRGIPALFGRETWPALQALQGDVGGRALAGRFVECSVAPPTPQALWDVDTEEDWERVRKITLER